MCKDTENKILENKEDLKMYVYLLIFCKHVAVEDLYRRQQNPRS